MPHDYVKLLKRSEDIIKSFNPIIMTVDSHIEGCLGGVKDGESLFVQQTFYGCVRYKAALKVYLFIYLTFIFLKIHPNQFIIFYSHSLLFSIMIIVELHYAVIIHYI